MTIAGGTKPIQYSIDGQTFQTSHVFTALQAGTYTLVAQDRAGCTVSQSVSVAASTGPRLAMSYNCRRMRRRKRALSQLRSTRTAGQMITRSMGKCFNVQPIFRD